MLKPLIRTIPNLSGNVKLSCSLADFKKVDDIYECYVRAAKLLPISKTLAQKQYEINLISSAYEFDLKRFYNGYSSIFYKSSFTYNTDMYNNVNKTEELYNRDKDFEFGVKRVSYIKNNGSQFSFFAPIWMDSPNDIPDYFLMNILIEGQSYSVHKSLKIHINESNKKYKYNYLSIYLNKYAKNLNTNVIFCTPLTNQATYYGIDLINGGFVKKIDNIIGKNYKFQSTINKFDLNITEGFKRNKICIKQIMPLAFLFSLEDILDSYELKKYKGARLKIDGAYWKDGKKVPIYDFSTDYTYFSQDSWLYSNGLFSRINTKRNLMSIEFPSLMESQYIGYEYFNKIEKESIRWKLKYSSDDYPYITNMSPAFSIAQNSSFKYREFPSTFEKISVFDDKSNNIMAPLLTHMTNDAKKFYSKDPRLVKRYGDIMQNNASNWFNVIDYTEKYEMKKVNNGNDVFEKEWYRKLSQEEALKRIKVTVNSDISHLNNDLFENIDPDLEHSIIEDIYEKCDLEYLLDAYKYLTMPENETFSYTLYTKNTIFNNPNYWSDIIDHKVYFKGILYDLSEIWKKYPETKNIDKFGVFVHPSFRYIENNMLSNIYSAKWTIFSNKSYITSPNSVLSTHIREMLSGSPVISSLYMSEMNIGKKMNEVSHDSLFFKANDGEDGNFIDLTSLGYDIYDINKYYNIEELKSLYPETTHTLETTRSKYIIEGYEQLPIYRLSQIVYNSESLWFEKNKMDKTNWIVSSLYFNTRSNHNKVKYTKDILSKAILKSSKYMLEVPLFIKRDFISAYDFSYLFNDKKVNVSYYMFNPISVDQNEIYAVNSFSPTKQIDINYGDHLIVNRNDDLEDIDFMYVDPYNLQNIMREFNVDFMSSPHSRVFYAKFLNKMHLKAYYLEAHKYYLQEYGSNIVHSSLVNLETKYEIIKNIYIKRRILFNDYENHKVYLKDLYIPLVEIYNYIFSDNSIEDPQVLYDNYIRRSLVDLEFDQDKGVWRFSKSFCNTYNIHNVLKFTENDPYLEEYNFELVFKKDFIKLNTKLWEELSLNNIDEFTDLFIYRISKEDDYVEDLIYQCLNNLDNSTFENSLIEDTCNTLEPLFDNVFIQNRNVSTIYSEYNQSKISKGYIKHNGVSYEYYRYDSDNTPVMIDISNFNIKNTNIIGYDDHHNPIVYYSYSYLNRLEKEYDPEDNTSLSYKYINKQSPFDNIHYLSTYNLIKNCSANIQLAYGTEQVKQYYSKYSYNYISRSYMTNISYYSEYEYNRINFDDLNTLTHQYENHQNYEIEYSDDNNIVVHSYNVTSYYNNILTYYDIHLRYIPNKIEYNDLNLYDEFKLSTYTVTYSYSTYYSYSIPITIDIKNSDGITSYKSTTYESRYGFVPSIGYCTYGMIFIDAIFDNTNSSFNLLDSFHNDKKYFTSINGKNIYHENYKVRSDFTELVPFIKFNLFDTINKETNFIVKPSRYILNLYNYPVKIKDTSKYDIISSKKPLSNIMLERYFDSITPLITKVSSLNNTYMLKLEDRELHSKIDISKGESILYNENINIYNNNGTRLYSGKTDYETTIQIESKHFNDNFSINLEPEISIFIGNNLTYNEVLEAETPENILRLFSSYIREFNNYDDDEILFLYNKYKVNYDSYPVGIDYKRIEKIYSLTIIFKLL